MDKKVPSVDDKNVDEIFKFYTLHQREVERALKKSVYADEKSSKDPFRKHASMPNIHARRVSTDLKYDLITGDKKSILGETKGTKVLDRLAKALDIQKPPEFEFWDFGYQSKKSLVKSSTHFDSSSFKGILGSLVKSLSKNSSEMSKKPSIVLKTTFHENSAKSCLHTQTKSIKQKESTAVKMESTFESVFGSRRRSGLTKNIISYRIDRKSTMAMKTTPKTTVTETSAPAMPLITATDSAKTAKKTESSKNLEAQGVHGKSRAFSRVNLLKNNRTKTNADGRDNVVLGSSLLSRLRSSSIQE
jgi:hypothetical protein